MNLARLEEKEIVREGTEEVKKRTEGKRKEEKYQLKGWRGMMTASVKWSRTKQLNFVVQHCLFLPSLET